jgi:hypothetical protein
VFETFEDFIMLVVLLASLLFGTIGQQVFSFHWLVHYAVLFTGASAYGSY